jgi:hypothetical protein
MQPAFRFRAHLPDFIKLLLRGALARYALLLSRGLFFARAQSFVDPWEGGWGRVDFQRFWEQNAELDSSALEASVKAANRAREDALRRYGVSCWHLSEHESVALWELYLSRGLGVAVGSSIELLQDAVTESSRNLTKLKVDYTDYADLELKGDALELLTHKRPEFAHEKEIRFVLEFRQDELDAMEAENWNNEQLTSRVIAPGRPRALPQGFRPTLSSDPTLGDRVAPHGVHLSTNVVRLIERVVLSPQVSYPTRRAILDLSKGHGVSDKVSESSVDAIPYHKIRVVEG